MAVRIFKQLVNKSFFILSVLVSGTGGRRIRAAQRHLQPSGGANDAPGDAT